jgi:VanZ family protein
MNVPKLYQAALAHPRSSLISKLCLACVLITIVYLSVTPNNAALIITFDGADKIKHAFAYFVLGMTASFAIPKRYYVLALIGFWLMSGVIAFLQGMQPTRTPSIYDLMANTVGLTLAYVTIKTINRTTDI